MSNDSVISSDSEQSSPVNRSKQQSLVSSKHHPPTSQQLPPPPKADFNIKIFESGVKATNMEHSTPQFKSDAFKFRTLEVVIRDDVIGEDIPGFTIGQYHINIDSQTKWFTYNVNTLYYVRKGEPWFMIGDEGKTLKVGYYVCIPKETRHCIYNKSANVEAIVDLVFPGRIVL